MRATAYHDNATASNQNFHPKTLLDLLDRPIAFHRVFVTAGGGVTAGLLLSQAFYWSRNKTAQARDGWFYKSAAEWEEETGLTRREQETARRHLRQRGLLEERMGTLNDVGRVLWFRVNLDALLAAVGAQVAPAEASGEVPRGSHRSAGGVAQIRHTPSHENAGRVAQKRQTPLITAETTPEITAETTPENTHTPRARAAAPAGSAAAGVSVSPSKSVFSRAERKAHAAAHGLGGGWLYLSQDGRYDEEIADARAAAQPAAVEQSLRTQPRPGMAYRAALLHLRSILDVNPRLDIAGAVAQLDVSDEDRARLLAFDFTTGRAAAASPGTGAALSTAAATPRAVTHH